MATVRVLEFSAVNPVTGAPIWPPQITKDVTVPGSHKTNPGTVLIRVSADVNCRMGMNEAAAAWSTPIIAAADANEFDTGASATETLYFIAE